MFPHTKHIFFCKIPLCQNFTINSRKICLKIGFTILYWKERKRNRELCNDNLLIRSIFARSHLMRAALYLLCLDQPNPTYRLLEDPADADGAIAIYVEDFLPFSQRRPSRENQCDKLHTFLLTPFFETISFNVWYGILIMNNTNSWCDDQLRRQGAGNVFCFVFCFCFLALC